MGKPGSVTALQLKEITESVLKKRESAFKTRSEKFRKATEKDLNERVKNFVSDLKKALDKRLKEEAKKGKSKITVIDHHRDREFVCGVFETLRPMCNERGFELVKAFDEPLHQNDPVIPSYTLYISWK